LETSLSGPSETSLQGPSLARVMLTNVA